MLNPPKYPSTKHWPWSETVQRDDSVFDESDLYRFVNTEVVITDKLDGGNTACWNGEVYARSTGQPATQKWFSLVKKHHAWKTATRNDIVFYGEDISAKHSIEYSDIKENETYFVFAARYVNPNAKPIDDKDEHQSWFADWGLVEKLSQEFGFQTVPVVYKGKFSSVEEITKFFQSEIKKPNALGAEREGFVMRIENLFTASEFPKSVVKYVRPNHVQTDQSWTRNWQWNGIVYGN